MSSNRPLLHSTNKPRITKPTPRPRLHPLDGKRKRTSRQQAAMPFVPVLSIRTEPPKPCSLASLFPAFDYIPPIDLARYVTDTVVGVVELNPELPSSLFRPYCHISFSAGSTLFGTVKKDEFRQKLEALTYLKAAKQLYSAMDSIEKIQNIMLHSVYSDVTELPVRLSLSISMIGDFALELGRVKVKDSTILFRRWIAAGLVLNPNGAEDLVDLTLTDAFRFVWRDKHSYEYIKRQIVRRVNSTLAPFQIVNYTVTSPVFNTEDPLRWSRKLHFLEPRKEEYMRYSRFYSLTSSQFNADDLPAEFMQEDLHRVLKDLNLCLAPESLQLAKIPQLFDDFIDDFATNYQPTLRKLFLTGPNATNNKGSPAQIVKSENNAAHYKFLVSDDDVALGFMFNPCMSFTLNPQYVAHSKHHPDNYRNKLALNDTKF